MRLLIACDGSACSDDALSDLARAGLPNSLEAVVISVAQWAELPVGMSAGACSNFFAASAPEFDDPCAYELQIAQSHADAAADRLRAAFPTWAVATETRVDSPAASIISKAVMWKPDLLVAGSRSGAILGSVAQAVLQLSPCSVRIARRSRQFHNKPLRIFVGVDGSQLSRAVVNSVLSRAWPADTEFRILGVIQLGATPDPGILGHFETASPAEYADVRASICASVSEAADAIERAGFYVTSAVREGRPERHLLSESAQWQADCIFLGSRAHRGPRHSTAQSICPAIAAQAHCSVEVIRR